MISIKNLKMGTVRIALCSDIMQHQIQHESGAKHGYDSIFSNDIEELLLDCNLVIGNLETPITGNMPEGFPKFNSSIEFLQSLSKYFDVLSLANNHALDQSILGLHETFKNVEKFNMKPVGALGQYVIRFELSEQKYVIQAFTDISNVQPIPVNSLNTKFREFEIAPDEIGIIYIHTGIEYSKKVTKTQYNYVDIAETYGYSACVMIHSHVVGDLLEIRNADRMFATNGLGNFIGFQENLQKQEGMIVILYIDQDNKNIVDAKLYRTETKLINNRQFVEIIR